MLGLVKPILELLMADGKIGLLSAEGLQVDLILSPSFIQFEQLLLDIFQLPFQILELRLLKVDLVYALVDFLCLFHQLD
jgi:hypothetical protein